MLAHDLRTARKSLMCIAGELVQLYRLMAILWLETRFRSQVSTFTSDAWPDGAFVLTYYFRDRTVLRQSSRPTTVRHNGLTECSTCSSRAIL